MPAPRDIDAYIAEELDLFSKIRPSLVVGDMRLSLSTSAELSDIPYAALSNVHWSPYRNLGFAPVPPQGIGARLRRKVREEILPWLPRRGMTPSFNRVRRRRGLSLFTNYMDLATRGDYTLYADPPGFIQTSPLPRNHLFLGPILWSPAVPRPEWWGTWDPKLPLIYVTLGSTGVARILPKIARTLASLPATVVVAAAGRAALQTALKNVFAADYLPGFDVCGLASLVVCNGGSATAYQALSQGRPVVGIWSNKDQYLTMMAIEQLGAGRGCRASECDARTLGEIVTDVLRGRHYREAAQAVAAQFAAWDAPQRFREFVRTFSAGIA